MKQALENFYLKIKSFFGHSEKVATNALKQIENDAPEIEALSEKVVPILDEILKMFGTKSAHEIQGVIDKFALHLTSVENDPVKLNSLIIMATTKAVANSLPGVSVENIQQAVTTTFTALNAAAIATDTPIASSVDESAVSSEQDVVKTETVV